MSPPETSHQCDRLDAMLHRQGKLACDQVVDLVWQVARLVAELHAQQRLHRAVDESHILWDGVKQIHLQQTPGEVTADGVLNVETWPPELHADNDLAIPVDFVAARVALEKVGIAMLPARIDVYQLSALLCRLVTGVSVAEYLESPRVKVTESPELARVIDEGLGFAPDHRLHSVDEFIAALNNCRSPRTNGEEDTTPSVIGKTETTTGLPVPRQPASSLPFQNLGHYAIVGKLGQGGMGDVYRAREERLHRDVAIKVLPPELARDQSFVQRFYAEARAAANIIHPNIVQIHFIGEEAGHHFFAMQYVDGEPLSQLLARRRSLPVDETLDIIEQAVAGLAAAHRQGLVHRDVKPGNILLDRRHQRALLADFGLVKSHGMERQTATGIVMGTVDYISPEQGRGLNVDGRSDLYSIGVLMYQMLSGRLPFQADGPTAMIFQHVYEAAPPLREVVPGIPLDLAAIIGKLLAKNPGARQQTAEALLADLRAFRTGVTPPSLKEVGPGALVTDIEVVDEPRRTEIIRAPKFDDEPPLPQEEIASPKTHWWNRARDQALGRFQAVAPQLAERLQNTQQQVHGAVAEYQRRHDQLSKLLHDAEAVRAELMRQRDDHAEAMRQAADRIAAAPGNATVDDEREKLECEEQVHELTTLLAAQDDEIEALRLKLAQVRSTLGQLRSQRDALNARLKVAGAQIKGTTAKPILTSRRRLVVIGMLGLIAISATVLVLSITLWRYARPIFSEFAPPAPNLKPTTNQGYDPQTNTPNTTQSSAYQNNAEQLIPVRQLLGHESPVNSVTFSPTMNLIATGSGDDTVSLWDAETGGLINQVTVENGSQVVAISPNGRLLASGSIAVTPRSFGITISDIATGNVVHSLAAETAVGALAFSHDGKTLAALEYKSRNDSRGPMRAPVVELTLWDVQDGQEAQRVDSSRLSIRATARTNGLAFSPKDDLLAVPVDDTDVALWDPRKQEVRTRLKTEIIKNLAVAFSHDGTALAAGGSALEQLRDGSPYRDEDWFNQVVVWDVDTGNRIGVFNTPVLEQILEPTIKSLAFSPSGDTLAVAEGSAVKIWDVRSAEVVKVLKGHIPYSIAYNHDGSLLLSGGTPKSQVFGPGHPYALLWRIAN